MQLKQLFCKSDMSQIFVLVVMFSLPTASAKAERVLPSKTLDLSPFATIKADVEPKKLIRNAHYVVSNELNHQIFQPHIENQGGALVGVGSDQLYLLAGWSKPKVVVPFDFDSVIVDIHRIYGAVFKAYDNPKDFLDAFRKKNLEQTVALIERDLEANCRRCAKLFRTYRQTLLWRLRRTKRDYERNKVPTFLTDDATYDFVASLHHENRVFPIRGDLRKDVGLRSVSEAAKKAGVPIRTLYLSNAEQYFRYDKTFRENIAELYTDDKTLILRTNPRGEKGTNSDDYWYFLQKVGHFRDYLSKKRNRNTKVYRLIYHHKSSIPRTDNRGFWVDR